MKSAERWLANAVRLINHIRLKGVSPMALVLESAQFAQPPNDR